jgi:hypothetical protein
MRTLFPALILAMALAGAIAVTGTGSTGAAGQVSAQGTREQHASTMKIRIDVEGRVITATLIDTPTARDFISLLPLTLTLKDYAATEKISDLPRRLSIEGAPAGIDPSIGDITYYSPWGNLALFYKDFGYSGGLVKLGKIDSGVEALTVPGPLRVMIELARQI